MRQESGLSPSKKARCKLLHTMVQPDAGREYELIIAQIFFEGLLSEEDCKARKNDKHTQQHEICYALWRGNWGGPWRTINRNACKAQLDASPAKTKNNISLRDVILSPAVNSMKLCSKHILESLSFFFINTGLFCGKSWRNTREQIEIKGPWWPI